MKTDIQKVSPSQAIAWLERSGGNRAMRSDHIASLAAQMRRGEWLINGSSIVFDTKGMLLDGHHRLMACHIADVAVDFLVVRGAETNALYTIDTGRGRTLGDHLTMHGGTYGMQRASYLSACVRAAAGISFPLRTIDAYLAWEPLFHDGTECYMSLGLQGIPFLRKAAIAGPLIVAFRALPEKMPAVYLSLRDGVDLKAGSPIHTLREWLIGITAATLARDTFDTGASKIFAAVSAHIEGRTLKRLQASSESVEWFRKMYSRGHAGKLIAEAKAMKNASRKVVEVLIPGKKSEAA